MQKRILLLIKLGSDHMTEVLNGSKAFLMIPASSAHDKSLLKHPKAILLLGEIVSMLNVTGVFYINNTTLSKRLDCSTRTIIRYLDILESHKLIKRKNIKNENGDIDHRKIYAGEKLAKSFTLGWESTSEDMSDTPRDTHVTTPHDTHVTTPVTHMSPKESINKENNNNRNIYSSAKAEPAIYKEVIDYLNEKAGTKYKSTSKATQRLINARVNDGFNIPDFKKVIDTKCAQWRGDKKMAKYLRPETLFGTKFEGYLNEKTPNVLQHADFAPDAFTNGEIEGVNEDELPF
ncbi:phage conserved hypothetical protein, C-terminal domain-containing protein [Lactobacillus bombicola]|uniref:Phage conserved hypothetical protein C-terminal domain-containing protein n=2 Tax=Lactobacillus bombicola TaxID=1505723 RepID=A0A1I1TNE0_9LACO|nr:phage conserved hypothetical protein, C-terminal domain-containing protein [Lactobacillus bombicola]